MKQLSRPMSEKRSKTPPVQDERLVVASTTPPSPGKPRSRHSSERSKRGEPKKDLNEPRIPTFDTPTTSPDNNDYPSPSRKRGISTSSQRSSSKKSKTNGYPEMNGYGHGYPHTNEHTETNGHTNGDSEVPAVPMNVPMNIDFGLLSSVLATTKSKVAEQQNNSKISPSKQKNPQLSKSASSRHKLNSSSTSNPNTSSSSFKSMKDPGRYRTSTDSKVWAEHVRKPLDSFHKKKQIDAKAYKILAKAFTEACCKGNFMWVWPQVQDIYKKNNLEKMKLLEKYKNLMIGPLVGEWLWKHLTKFYKDNNITSVLSEGEQLQKLKTELVTKIMKYTKKKKLESKNRVGNTKSMLAMLTDSNIPIDQ